MTMRGTSPDPKLREIKIVDKQYLERLLEQHIKEAKVLVKRIAHCPDGPKNHRRQVRLALLCTWHIPYVAKLLKKINRPLCVKHQDPVVTVDGQCAFCLLLPLHSQAK